MPNDENRFDVAVIGGGLVGLTAALALSDINRNVVLCTPNLPEKDPRTTAVLQSSIDYFQAIGVWDDLAEKGHPLSIMRLVDATNRLLRFQQTDFNAAEIGLPAFGYNFRNQDILGALLTRVNASDCITLVTGTVTSIDESEDGNLSLKLDQDGSPAAIHADFLVGADGRNSLVRQHIGCGERQWSYPQTAIVLDFEHQFPSGQISTEFHTESGPFTVVPQTSQRAGLVWLENPAKAEEILQMDEAKLAHLLEAKMHSILGRITLASPPKSFPMSGMAARKFGEGNIALIGEAAHVFPPIGAQGFNLGVRDISTLVDVLRKHTNTENPGLQYHRNRSLDINSRTYGVDMLNRTLLSGFLPAQMIKTAAMLALGTVSPLRKQVMKMGIHPITTP